MIGDGGAKADPWAGSAAVDEGDYKLLCGDDDYAACGVSLKGHVRGGHGISFMSWWGEIRGNFPPWAS